MVFIFFVISPVILKQIFPKKSLYWFQQLIFWSCQIKLSCFKYSSPLDHKLSTYHMLTNSSLIRAGASGGGMGDRPRWVRILLITGGSLIEAMIFIFPLQWMHFEIESSRLKKCFVFLILFYFKQLRDFVLFFVKNTKVF